MFLELSIIYLKMDKENIIEQEEKDEDFSDDEEENEQISLEEKEKDNKKTRIAIRFMI